MTTPTTASVTSTGTAPDLPDGMATLAPDATRPPLKMHPLGLAAALAAVMIPIMSFFTVNVALGSIGADLDASPAVLQLVVTAYGVVCASLVATGGRLGDGFGRKRLLALGMLVFAVTSLFRAFAQTPAQLVGATLHAANEGHHRMRAMAWFGASAGLGTSLAFLIGGTLTDSDLGWRSIFWVSVPIAALVMIGVWRFVPETKAPTRPALDLVGAGLLGTALTLLVLPLTEGRATGWPAWTWVCLGAVLPVLAVLAWWQRRLEARGRSPLVPPALFRFRSISVGLVAGLPFFLAFGGFMFVYGYATQVAGRSPLDVGVSLLPMSLGFLVASLAGGRLVPRDGVWVLTWDRWSPRPGSPGSAPPASRTPRPRSRPSRSSALASAWSGHR